ncbi:hypothetical protein MRX96_040323 [Rhipicephalus microplus]
MVGNEMREATCTALSTCAVLGTKPWSVLLLELGTSSTSWESDAHDWSCPERVHGAVHAPQKLNLAVCSICRPGSQPHQSPWALQWGHPAVEKSQALKQGLAGRPSFDRLAERLDGRLFTAPFTRGRKGRKRQTVDSAQLGGHRRGVIRGEQTRLHFRCSYLKLKYSYGHRPTSLSWSNVKDFDQTAGLLPAHGP